MSIGKKDNKWMVLLIALFIITVFNSYEVQAETNTNGESIEVDEIVPTTDTEELYMSREEAERLLKESSQEYELKLLEYKLEAQTEKNGVLQGNIGTILSLLAIIIAVIVAILGLLWKWFESRVKTNISSSLRSIESIETKIEETKIEIKNRHMEINESYKKIKDLEDDIRISNTNYKRFLEDKKDLRETSNNILKYVNYLEVRYAEVEWACKFFAQRELRNKTINELKHLIDNDLKEKEQIAIIKFKRKYGNNITEDDSKLSNITTVA